MKKLNYWAKYILLGLLMLLMVNTVRNMCQSNTLTNMCKVKQNSKQEMVYKVVPLYEKQGKKKTEKEIQLYARSAALMDADNGRILYQKNGQKRLPMASTTKIMTCLVVLEHAKLDDIVVISSNAAKQPKVRLNVSIGEKYYVKDLLYALMLESYNDVAVALAEHVGKSVEGFAALMNQKAKELHCYNTHFVTPNGLDATDHYSSAEDLCKMGAYARKNDTFMKIINTAQHSFSELSKGRNCSVHNKDLFLSMYAGAIGIKTGFTGNAGYCFVGAVKRNDRTLVSAVLAAGWPPNKSYKWADTKALMDYGCNNYKVDTVFDCKFPFTPVSVRFGEKEKVSIASTTYKRKMLLDGKETQKILSIIPEYLNAPVKKGATIGQVYYFLDGNICLKKNIYTSEAIQKNSFFSIYKSLLWYFCS